MCVYLCSMKNPLFPFLDCCLSADCQAKSNEHRATYTLNVQCHWSLSASLEREYRYLIFCLVFVPKHVKIQIKTSICHRYRASQMTSLMPLLHWRTAGYLSIVFPLYLNKSTDEATMNILSIYEHALLCFLNK